MDVQIDAVTGELLCEIRDRVATVTLNKPHKKNALGDILTPALRQTMLELEDRSDVGCVMIAGAGDAFCSGDDVSGMGGDAADRQEPTKSLQQMRLTTSGREMAGLLRGVGWEVFQ